MLIVLYSIYYRKCLEVRFFNRLVYLSLLHCNFFTYSSEKSPQDQTSETGVVTVEQCQRSTSESSTGEVAIETKLHEQLEGVGRELSIRQEKKLK